jgi:aspartyl protease family protein
MGSEDRDYWHKEKSKNTGSFLARFEAFTQKTSMLWIGVFWLTVMGVLYLAMSHYSSQRQTVVTSNGVLTIQKDRDGHFYIPGSINGQDVMFVVDTGATIISVSDEVARLAKLPEGEPAQFNTAAGSRQGTIVSGVTVQVGSFSASNMRVSTGLQMGDGKEALLGQNFLSKFKMSVDGNQLTLAPLSGS